MFLFRLLCFPVAFLPVALDSPLFSRSRYMTNVTSLPPSKRSVVIFPVPSLQGLWWAQPPETKLQLPPKLKYETLQVSGFLSNFNVKPPRTNVKPPYSRLSGNDSVFFIRAVGSNCVTHVCSLYALGSGWISTQVVATWLKSRKE